MQQGDDHWTRRYPERVPRGARHPRAALRGVNRRVAIELHMGGSSIRHIARQLGVSRKAVSNVIQAGA